MGCLHKIIVQKIQFFVVIFVLHLINCLIGAVYIFRYSLILGTVAIFLVACVLVTTDFD